MGMGIYHLFNVDVNTNFISYNQYIYLNNNKTIIIKNIE